MRGSIKVPLFVLAITVGASAPTLIVEAVRPGSIAPLERPVRQINQRDEGANHPDYHQNANGLQPPGGYVATDVASGQHGRVGTKAEEHGKWHKNPDWWVAIFTAALFAATVGLWIFTALLWRTTRRAVIESQDAIRAATRHADAAVAAERAYLSGGGPIFNGIISEDGNSAETEERLGLRRLDAYRVFQVNINNYGKTPGDLVEVQIGYINKPIPDKVPPLLKLSEIIYFRDWIGPDTRSRAIKFIRTPEDKSIIYGRLYYRDIILRRYHSSGFILEMLDTGITRPIRAPEEYTEERDEPDYLPNAPEPDIA